MSDCSPERPAARAPFGTLSAVPHRRRPSRGLPIARTNALSREPRAYGSPQLVLLAAIVLLIGASGCRRESPSPDTFAPDATAPREPATDATVSPGIQPGPSAATPRAASSAVASLLDRYRSTTHYEDRCELHLRYSAQEGPRHDRTQLAMVRRGTHHLRIDITRDDSRLHILGDGTHAQAWVDDPATADMSHEVVRRPAPQTWSVSELYSTTETLDPRRPQQMISLLLGLPVHLQATHLGLLLNDPYWQSLEADPRRFEQLEDALLPGSQDTSLSHAACARLRVNTPDGPLTLWWDASNRTLRRMDLPTGNLFAELPAEQRPRDVQLYLEWEETRWEAAAGAGDRFTREERPGEVDVRYFVLPPMETVDSAESPPQDQKLGSEPPRHEDARGLKLVSTTGQDVQPGEWPEPLVVLAWVQDHEASHEVLPALQRTAEQSRAAGLSVRWELVCPDDLSALPERQWTAMLSRLRVDLSTLRDPLASGRDTLAIEEAPTVVVLDPARRVRHRIVGAAPDLEQQLTRVLRKLADGSSLDGNAGADTAAIEARKAFEHHLQLARGTSRAVAPATTLPPERGWKRLQADVAWKSAQPTAPGNLLVWSAAEPQAGGTHEVLGVLHEQREVYLLDDRGEVMAHHPLELNDQQRPTHWERRENAAGEAWFAFHAKFGESVSVFDGTFRRLFSYPPRPLGSATVLDAKLADLDRDGTPELYVGFSEPAGVHCVDMSGNRRWQQPAIGAGVALVASGNETDVGLTANTNDARSLLVVQGETGAILPVGLGGEIAAAEFIGPPPRVLHGLAFRASLDPSHPPAGNRAVCLGLSYTLEGRPIALGLDPRRKESWAYGLPAGVFRFQVHPPQWTAWPSEKPGSPQRGAWWIAGPDGSLHMVQDDGRLYDHLQTGRDVAGFALAPRPQGVRLYVSHESEVVALDIQPPPQPTPSAAN